MDRPFPAYKGEEPYIFVCYAHEDSDVVYPELQRLHDGGVNIWYDEGISPGNEWSQELAQAIEGAQRFLYFVSPSSVASRYCRNEVQYALDQDKPIAAIHLQETEMPGGLKLSLGSSQAIMKYEISPEEYERKLANAFALSQPPVRAAPIRSSSPTWRWLTVTLIGLAAIAAIGAWWIDSRSSLENPQSIGVTQPAIAVLPFVNLNKGPEQLFFSDGIAEDIISGLARYDNLTVKARTSSFVFRNRASDISVIARELGVTHIVEGSTRRVGDRVRVNVQLIDAADGSMLWAASHDEELQDVFAVQDEITSRILQALHVQFSDERRVERRPIDPQAYLAFLRGQYHFARNDLATALTLYERAIELEPDFADAHARLAQLYANQNGFGVVPVEQVVDKFIHHNSRATEIEPSHPLGSTGLALANLWFHRDFQKAADQLGRLCALYPSDVDIIIACNLALSLFGYSSAAAVLIDEIVTLDPLSPLVYMQRAQLSSAQRSAADTLADLEESMRLGLKVGWAFADFAAQHGDAEGLAQYLHGSAEEWSGHPISLALLKGQLLQLRGDQAGATRIADDILATPGYVAALFRIRAALMKQDVDLAADLLDAALAAGDIAVSILLPELRQGRIWPPVVDKEGQLLQVLKLHRLDRNSIDQLDLRRLLLLVPESARQPDSI